MNTKLRIRLVLSALVVVLWTVAAAPWAHAGMVQVIRTAQGSGGGDLTGWSVAATEEMAVIGAPVGDADTVLDTGAAYVLGYDQVEVVLNQDDKVWALDRSSLAGFGWSVAATSQLVAVGAPTATANANPRIRPTGAVYLGAYRYDDASSTGKWVQVAELAAGDPTPTPGDLFGRSVAIADNLLVVGAPGVNAVYVFRLNGTQWGPAEKLSGTPGTQFGTSVAVSGETIVVGAPGANLAYVFRSDSSKSVEEARLTGSDSQAGDRFGAAVTLDGDTLAVGAPGNDGACPGDPACDSGAAYLFAKTGGTWSEQRKLVGAAEGGDQFGGALSLNGSVLVIGARFGQDDTGTRSGYAYLLRYDGENKTWKPAPKPKLTLGEGAAAGDQFGYAVAAKGTRVVVGGPYAASMGVVAMFTLNRPPVADGPAKLEAQEGDKVTLDGSASSDPDGDMLTNYMWVQTPGSQVTISHSDQSPQATFDAPEVPAGEETLTLTFELTVNDGEEWSEPFEVTVVVTRPKKTQCQVTSQLGEKRPWVPDRDMFTFQGNKGDVIALTLQAAQDGTADSGRAVLILQDKIRGTWFLRADRRALPNEIHATLPATGEYLVTVMDDPFCRRSARFRGDYVLSLEGASGCLEQAQRRLAVKKKVAPPANSCHEKESFIDGFWF